MSDNQPTLVNPIPADPNPGRVSAPELDDNIIARPLVMPDFVNVKPKSPDVSFRWIEFKARDGLRYSQALAQGWTNVTQHDVAPGTLSPYVREGGTKFINGDLILMKIARSRYLGALKHRHMVSAALSDASVQRTITAKQSAAQLAAVGATGKNAGKMSVFTPDAADLGQTVLGEPGAVGKIPGLGGTPGVDKGTGNDIRSGK